MAQKKNEQVQKIGTTHGLKSIPGRELVVDYLLSKYDFSSILDLGCGYGDLFRYLEQRGASFDGYGVDMIEPKQIDTSNFRYSQSSITEYSIDRNFDLVFSSHVIEHVPDTQSFLNKFLSLTKEGGVFCLIWPPPKANIAGGHVHMFSMGLMLYNLVRSGIDCSQVDMVKCGYNLAIMGTCSRVELPPLTYNSHELRALEPYFPFRFSDTFNGESPPGVVDLMPPWHRLLRKISSSE